MSALRSSPEVPHQASKKLVDDPSKKRACKGLEAKGTLGEQGWRSNRDLFSQRIVRRGRAKSLLSCPTLCDPVDHSPPGSSVHGIRTERSCSTQLVTETKEGSVGRNSEDASPKLAE